MDATNVGNRIDWFVLDDSFLLMITIFSISLIQLNGRQVQMECFEVQESYEMKLCTGEIPLIETKDCPDRLIGKLFSA